MKNNIYDISISELIIRMAATVAAAAGTARLEISSSLGLSEVPENFSDTSTFTSEVVNLPTGYTVKANTHIITTPTSPVTTTGSTTPLITTSHAVILGAVGATYTVTSTVTLEKSGDPDIVLNGSLVITSVLPIYYGIKAAPVGTPDSTSLYVNAYSITNFVLSTSILGRLYIAIPTALNGDDFKGVKVLPNGTWIYETDFTQTTVGPYEYYVLNYDTQLTGTYNKTFEIMYQDTVISLPNPYPPASL